MELFSKRYRASDIRWRYRVYRRRINEEREDALIDESTRLRLQEEIRFIVQSNEFLERFIVTDDKENNNFILNLKEVTAFSKRELGYDFSELVQTRKMLFLDCEGKDSKLFDLIEMLFIFAKNEKRSELTERFRKILAEENTPFVVHGHMIFSTEATGLRSIVPLLKPGILKEKLDSYYRGHAEDHQWCSKVASEIIQHLFSSPKGKQHTKTESKKLCKKVASKLTTKKHASELADLISNSALHAKVLSNQIENIRHTDQHTIPVDAPNFYKLVATVNLAIAELVILSLPENYVTTSDPENLKNDYLIRFNVNKDEEWFIAQKTVRIEDIPF